MKDQIERLVAVIKLQAEAFLLNAGEFYPFGTLIDNKGNIVPTSAYIEAENDRPLASDLIEILEKAFKKDILSGDSQVCAIAIDGAIRENGQRYDAIEVRFFEKDKTHSICIKYHINTDHVDFF